MSNLEDRTVCNLVQVDVSFFLKVFIGHFVAPRPTLDRLKDNLFLPGTIISFYPDL